MDLLDELFEHLLGHGEIGDNPVFHRADCRDIARGTAEHLLCRQAYFLDDLLAVRPALLPDCDHRGLVEDDALAANIDQRIGGTEVDRQVVGEVAV